MQGVPAGRIDEDGRLWRTRDPDGMTTHATATKTRELPPRSARSPAERPLCVAETAQVRRYRAAPNSDSARGYQELSAPLANPTRTEPTGGQAVCLCIASTGRDRPLLPPIVCFVASLGGCIWRWPDHDVPGSAGGSRAAARAAGPAAESVVRDLRASSPPCRSSDPVTKLSQRCRGLPADRRCGRVVLSWVIVVSSAVSRRAAAAPARRCGTVRRGGSRLGVSSPSLRVVRQSRSTREAALARSRGCRTIGRGCDR